MTLAGFSLSVAIGFIAGQSAFRWNERRRLKESSKGLMTLREKLAENDKLARHRPANQGDTSLCAEKSRRPSGSDRGTLAENPSGKKGGEA